MSKYTVKIYDGDYPERQEKANQDGAICYFEQHFNAREYHSEKDGLEDNPIMAICSHNASNASLNWGYVYCEQMRVQLGNNFPVYAGNTAHKGVLRRKFKERGDYNLRFTKMPAIIGEPLWLSDSFSVNYLRQEATIDRIAHATVNSIVQCFPDGGLVALSIGHMGKTSTPFDTGAPVRGHPSWNEAAFAEKVIRSIAAKIVLMGRETPSGPSLTRNEHASLLRIVGKLGLQVIKMRSMGTSGVAMTVSDEEVSLMEKWSDLK